MMEFFEWLEGTGIANAIRTTPWMYPTFETAHYIGLSLLVGGILLIDLRTLGFARVLPLRSMIGLLPFVGDLVGVALSSYILSEASRMGVPRSVLLRMAFNMGLEGLVGVVPVAGDVFDAAFKANQRNVRLLEAWLDQPVKTERSTRAFGAILLLACIGFLTLLGAGSYFLIRLILDNL